MMKLQRKISSSCESCRKSCRASVASISVESNRRPRPARGLPMRMTSVSFFEFLHKNNSVLSKMDITEFPLSVLDQITKADIEEYWNIFVLCQRRRTEYTNDERREAP